MDYEISELVPLLSPEARDLLKLGESCEFAYKNDALGMMSATERSRRAIVEAESRFDRALENAARSDVLSLLRLARAVTNLADAKRAGKDGTSFFRDDKGLRATRGYNARNNEHSNTQIQKSDAQ